LTGQANRDFGAGVFKTTLKKKSSLPAQKCPTTNNGCYQLHEKGREKDWKECQYFKRPDRAHNDPAFKRRRFSFFVEVTD